MAPGSYHSPSSRTNISFSEGNGTDENFRFVDDFEKHKSAFQADTFELSDYSSDGGQLIAYFARNKEYRVIDIWLFWRDWEDPRNILGLMSSIQPALPEILFEVFVLE